MYLAAPVFARRLPRDRRSIGTNIERAASTQAISGTFRQADKKNVPALYRDKCFPSEDETWAAPSEAKRYVGFKYGSLLAGPSNRAPKLILCRNVAIDSTEAAKARSFARLGDALKPGGYLLQGSAERVNEVGEPGLESALPIC